MMATQLVTRTTGENARGTPKQSAQNTLIGVIHTTAGNVIAFIASEKLNCVKKKKLVKFKISDFLSQNCSFLF
jgi:hypothetical protein